MPQYDPKKIEQKWQKKWLNDKAFAAKDDSTKPKYYQLETFPYPSGAGLHVGHPKGYIAEDIHARYTRMGGKDGVAREVLYTMGWDAFGLPTENYAIKVGKTPREVTKENTENFTRQMRMFGNSYDWDREINTSLPDYYKWTQWLFLQLFKKGLAYQSDAKVNWCPKDQTVLANEQVVNGKCERCGSEIQERDMEQWFFRITKYADRLLEGLKKLDWPSSTVKRQEDWIGKSTGMEIDFPLNLDYRYVLLHGFDGSPDDTFFPWLKRELTRHGVAFVAPQLPNPESPSESEQVDYVLKNVQFNEKTVLYGHSLGAAVAFKVLEKLERPIAGLVISSAFIQPKFKDHPRPFENTFKWEFDFDKIQKNVGFIRIVSDLNDDSVPEEQARLIHQRLDGRLREVVANKPHFSAEEEPEILTSLLPLITVFTTRPDTVFGATYLVLAPEHIAIKAMSPKIINKKEIDNYVEAALKKTELMRQEGAKEKTGIEIKGVVAINPATKEEIPIWVADYVLLGYGTGAIMAVPAHDERDFEFAKKFKIRIRAVITPEKGVPPNVSEKPLTGKGFLVNSGKFNGMDSEAAQWEVGKEIGGRGKEHYKLRDWSVSRQRYWGVPIPMIHCEKCGTVPVDEKDLPVILPDLKDFRPRGIPPLAASEDFMNVKCPSCDSPAKRDPETLDTFVDSSWYYLRYPDPHNDKAIFDKEKIKHWMPVDLYVIGAEHTVLHLLYSRFITKFLHDEGLLDFEEPFLKLRHQGLIRGADGRKMSKSIGNVVNPDDIVNEFGADTMRLYEMFMGPFEDGAPWDPKAILGVNRFLIRVWNYFSDAKAATEKNPLPKALLQRTIKKVGEDIQNFKFNTAISALMILLNEIEAAEPLSKEDRAIFVKLLHPFAPHIAQELWDRTGNNGYLDFEAWPKYDASLIAESTIKLIFQVNGKVRDAVDADATITEEAAKALAMANAKVQAALKGQEPKRVVYVDKKLVNIVL